MSKARKQGDKASWNGSECILWPELGMARKDSVVQSFILDRVARFTVTQRKWLVHWLRTTATTAKNVDSTVESLVAVAECIERSPVKGKPFRPFIRMKSKYRGKCTVCSKPHGKGDEIVWRAGNGSFCQDCAKKVAPLIMDETKMRGGR